MILFSKKTFLLPETSPWWWMTSGWKLSMLWDQKTVTVECQDFWTGQFMTYRRKYTHNSITSFNVHEFQSLNRNKPDAVNKYSVTHIWCILHKYLVFNVQITEQLGTDYSHWYLQILSQHKNKTQEIAWALRGMLVGYIHLKHFEYVQNINVTYRKIIHRNLAGWNKLFEDYNSWEVLTVIVILMSFYFMSEMRWGFDS